MFPLIPIITRGRCLDNGHPEAGTPQGTAVRRAYAALLYEDGNVFEKIICALVNMRNEKENLGKYSRFLDLSDKK